MFSRIGEQIRLGRCIFEYIFFSFFLDRSWFKFWLIDQTKTVESIIAVKKRPKKIKEIYFNIWILQLIKRNIYMSPGFLFFFSDLFVMIKDLRHYQG